MTSNLRTWLREQGFSVRHLAQELGLPITTVEDWVYRGATPSSPNQEKLHTFLVLIVDLFQAANLVAEGWSSVAAENQRHRLLALEAGELDPFF